jgi:hypothetical protein
MTRRVVIWTVGSAAAIAAALVGVVLYARRPDVDTLWLNVLLVTPLLLICLGTLHRVLPQRLQWIAAVVLAPLGGIAYLVWPNDQWWNYGALTALPLILLAGTRAGGQPPDASAVGMGDGPWGPP